MIERILEAGNLTKACREVVRNRGAGGIDRMPVRRLKAFLDTNRELLCNSVRSGEYLPQPIRGKKIPKGNKKMRLLGIPTAVDRMLQQATLRVVMPQYEPEFSEGSHGLFTSLLNFFKVFMNSLRSVPPKPQYASGSLQGSGLHKLRISEHCGN